MLKCLVCNKNVERKFRAKVLNRYNVDYFFCDHCGFLQTAPPYWLHEAYSAVIAKTDTGLVARNLNFARLISSLICTLFHTRGRFVDYGGGYGLLVRLMRDRGFDFYLYDQYCENMFAEHFAISNFDQKSFELLTAIEVFEHLSDPVNEITKMLKLSDSILFSTRLLPKATPRPADWWYYSLETGQHVSFFSLKSLRTLASRFNLNLYSNRINIHLLSKKKFNPFLFNLFSNHLTTLLFSPVFRRRSLLPRDYKIALNKTSSL